MSKHLIRVEIPSSAGEFTLSLKTGTKILSVGVEDGVMYLRVVSDPNNISENRFFLWVETGGTLEDSGLIPIGTVFIPGGFFAGVSLNLFEQV